MCLGALQGRLLRNILRKNVRLLQTSKFCMDARSCWKKVGQSESGARFQDLISYHTPKQNSLSHPFNNSRYIMSKTSSIASVAIVLIFAIAAGYWTKLVGETVTTPYLVRNSTDAVSSNLSYFFDRMKSSTFVKRKITVNTAGTSGIPRLQHRQGSTISHTPSLASEGASYPR